MLQETIILSVAYIILIGWLNMPKKQESAKVDYFPEIEEVTGSELNQPIVFNLPVSTPNVKSTKSKKSLNTLIREESRKKGLTGKQGKIAQVYDEIKHEFADVLTALS